MRSLSHPTPAFPIRLLYALVLSASLAACGAESSEALLEKAQQSLNSGDRKTAIIQLKSAIQEDEKNAKARFQLGKLYLEGGAFSSAEKELARARASGYDASLVNPLLAKALIGQGEYKRVLDELPEPSKGGKADVPMLIMRATAQLGTGDKEEARKSLSQATAAAPTDVDVLLAQARLALADRDVAKAAERIDAALQIDPRHRDAWLFKADLLRATGKSGNAAEAYQTALRLDPGHEGARLALANIAISENRLADARREIDTVLKASRNNLQARYLQALVDFREKKNEVARDHLAELLKSTPDYLPAVLLAGSVDYALGNMQSAESHLKRVVAALPRNLYALRLLAAAQLRQGRHDDAERTLAGVPDSVNDAGFHLVAGDIALAKKQFAKAAEHFEKAAQISPDSAAIRTELGLARLVQGDQRALADLQAAAAMEGSGNRADAAIILHQLKQKQFDAALASIAALEKKQGTNPITWNYRGAAYLAKKDSAKARESFGQALKLDPAFFPAAANLAQLDLRDNKRAAARKRFEDILKADPKHLNAMLALADFSMRDKDEKAYVGWLEKASQAHPKALQPRSGMVAYLLRKGDKDRAIVQAREAVNANPDNPAALNLLGATQMAVGDKAGAIATFSAMTAKAEPSADAQLNLAMAQMADKRLADARIALKKALQIKPDHVKSQDALISVEMADKKPEAALVIARSLQVQQPGSPLGFLREGDIHFEQKRAPQAIKAYQQALEKGAGSTGLIKLHRAYLLAGDASSAEIRVKDWLRKNPADNAVRNYVAEYHMLNLRNKEAIAYYQEILRQVPNDMVSLNNLANLYRVENDKRALATAEQAHKLAPGNPAVQDTLGWILVEQGQAARGLDLLKKAVAGAPREAAIRYHHAAALARTGDKAQARKTLESLLLDTPDFPEGNAARALLKSL